MPIVRTETFFDGSHFEGSCPTGWTFRRDKSVRGYPHVFEADPGYRLQLGWSRDVRINCGNGITRADIPCEPLRVAYVMTLHQAHWHGAHTIRRFIWASMRGIRRSESKIRRHDFPGMSGFTYQTGAGWAGWFTRAPRYLYVLFSRAAGSNQAREDETFEILKSLRFVEHESAV